MYIVMIEDPCDHDVLCRDMNMSEEEAEHVYNLAIHDPENKNFDVSIIKLVKVRFADASKRN